MRKKILAALLAVCMVVTLLPATVLAASFDDINGHWGASAIQRWTDAGVLNGKDDGVFDPDGPMTRAEFATMMINLTGESRTSDKTFDDVAADAWYAGAISKAVAANIMGGIGGGKMDPDGIVSRQQSAVMLCRAFGIKPSGKADMTFADADSVEDWAKDAMTALAEKGMMNGVGNNMVDPWGVIDRAAIATLADNIVPVYIKDGVAYISEKAEADVEVTVAEDGTITISGKIEGVPLISGSSEEKVVFENATIEAPIVAVGAEVTMVNSSSEGVKVSGENAVLTADEDSAVGDIIVGGANAQVDVKGECGDVTIEKGAEGAVVEAPNAGEVTNESEAPVLVNGETVKAAEPEPEPTPDDPTKDPEDKTDDTTTSSSSTEETEEKVKAPAAKTCPHDNFTYVKIDAKQHSKTCAAPAGAGMVVADPPEEEAEEDYRCGSVVLENHTFDSETGICTATGCGANKLDQGGEDVKEGDGASNCEDGAHEWKTTPEEGATKPTCVAGGKTTYKCNASGCTATKDVYTAALGHTYGTPVTVAATCVAGGTATKTCTREGCTDSTPGHSVVTQTAPLGHSWNGGEVTKAASCQEPGTKTYTCTREGCGDGTAVTETVEIPKDENAHDLIAAEAVAVSGCTTDGKSSGVKCKTTGCDYNTQKVVKAPGHKNVMSADMASCKCSVCGENSQTHSECSENDGRKECAKCGWKGQTTEEASAHTKCTTVTLKGDSEKHFYLCSVCGKTYEDKDAKTEGKANHTVSKWTKDGEGKHTGSCTLCGMKAEGTCDTEGTDGVCSKCGYKADPVEDHEGACQATGDWINDGEGNHYKACSLKKSDGKTACDKKVNSTPCAADADSPTYDQGDDTNHYKKCATCNTKLSTAEAHTKAWNEDGASASATSKPCACGKTFTCTHGNTEANQKCATCHTTVTSG